jgi:hypothetical protein
VLAFFVCQKLEVRKLRERYHESLIRKLTEHYRELKAGEKL